MKENLCIFEVLVLRDFLSAVKSTCVRKYRADNLTCFCAVLEVSEVYRIVYYFVFHPALYGPPMC